MLECCKEMSFLTSPIAKELHLYCTHTLVQMALQLVELGLLDTNLQVDHSIGGGTTQLRPSLRHDMSLLHSVWSARLEGAAKDTDTLEGDRDCDGHQD